MILGIYGAGGAGRELLDLAKSINSIGARWEKFLFIDDRTEASEVNKTEVISFEKLKQTIGPPRIELIIALGEPELRAILREKVTEAGYSLATLIHPSSVVGTDTVIGPGAVIQYGCFISCNAVIGENVFIQPNVCIGHDTVVHSDAVISSYVCAAGHCTIGEKTYIGMSVPIKEGSVIGKNTIVGMGSVVLKDLPDGIIALGNPARPMKKNENHRVFK